MILVFLGVIIVGYASSETQSAATHDSHQPLQPLQPQRRIDQSLQPASSTDAPANDNSDATVDGGTSATRAALGGVLVVGSQLFTALQMCLEERFVTGYNMPALLAVGYEVCS